MDPLVQCPVCTLFLHNGMTLESHLDTHPKDQVIKALCSLTAKGINYGSRTSTPLNSERSYRSRSRTPATDDSGRWNGSQRSVDHDRYWRRTPSRTKSTPLTNVSRNVTPDIRITENMPFEAGLVCNSIQQSNPPFIMKSDKMQQTYQTPMSEFEQQYSYYPEQQEDREIKYSRSAEYTALDNTNNLFAYNMPTTGPGVKLQTTLIPGTVTRRSSDVVKLLPKPNNILVKTNMGGMQYIAPGIKPMHVMVPTPPTFVQKNVQNNMIMTSIPPPQVHIETKSVAPSLSTNQFSQLTSGAFTPGTTVVTQNSQIIYREMVHNIDGKPFISSMPAVLTGHDNVANVAQATSMYQNVMVVDPFGNASCMYTAPQPILSKGNTSIYTDHSTLVTGTCIDKPIPNIGDSNKTLIIEVGPIQPSESDSLISCDTTTSELCQSTLDTTNSSKPDTTVSERVETKNESNSQNKGLKILSNIKVEVPVQHHKNMVNTVMDLTGSNDQEYPENSSSPEKILPDIDKTIKSDISQDSNMSVDSKASHTFSVIKNVGNPPLYKDCPSKTNVDNKLDAEFGDSCPVPDLICNEKPSISPCSELSENGDNSTDSTQILPKPECIQSHNIEHNQEKKIQCPPKLCRNNTLRLNNIYVKKNKKVLQIKNAKKSFLCNSNKSEIEPMPSSSTCRSPENFTITKIHCSDNSILREKSTLLTVSVEEIKENDEQNDFDADTEEQSMDIEPVAPSSINHSHEFTTKVDMVQVKEEINTSNEGGFTNETITSDRELTTLETLRPINVITYGNMPAGDFEEESNHRELLDLEAASKNKQFVSMMNENYFGDNIYADYFTPDRVESFDDREPPVFKEGPKEGMYGCGIWGESSQKENEFVLPNFIHESYKIAESNGIDYSEMGDRDNAEVDGERDSKADVLSESRSEGEPPLNICANERMPPRGELSGQESNGDMESPWTAMYTEVTPSEPYDLIARESWVSDGSEMDATEKRDTLEDDLHFSKGRSHTCMHCGAKFLSLKELRGHKATAHVTPTCSSNKNTYSRLVTARNIKKEEKPDATILTSNILAVDSKESITSTILQVYDTMDDSKPKIEGLIKQEPKRRRKDYVCPTCKVDQLTDAAFQAHLKIHPLECLTCGKCFFKRGNLALHLKTHLGIKNYKCEVCEKRFITRQKLMEHHNIHTGRAPVKCTVCDDTFRRYSNMVQHRDRHHFQKRAKVRDYVCACGGVFHSRAKLRWHRETHEDRPKACPYCSDKFVHAASLTRHVRRSHNQYFHTAASATAAVAASTAPTALTAPAAPAARARARTGVDNVSCPVCKQVYLRTNLRAHLLTHSGKRPYPCVVCNKAFTTKWNLKLHRWTHASRSAKPYKCTLCKGAFVRHTEYVSHMNAHKAVRPYTCNYCGCQFIRKYNCQRHVREHELAKRYVCKVPECGKSFHRSYYLSEHMKVHSGVRPFSCNICGKTSSNKSNHNKHVKIHHAREPVATEA